MPIVVFPKLLETPTSAVNAPAETLSPPIGELIEGTQALFSMGLDLAALLAVGGDIGGGIFLQKIRIGGPNDSVGLVNGALNDIFGIRSCISSHSKPTLLSPVTTHAPLTDPRLKFNEGDASATREDVYLNSDNISLQPTLFQQLHQRA